MTKLKTLLSEILNERSSSEILRPKRNQWVEIPKDKYDELEDEFFDLIKTAYAPIGGNLKIQKPEDVFSNPKITFWKGIDLHGSPDLDLIMFGKNTNYGVKFSGVGHDGTKDSKSFYLQDRAKALKDTQGFYGEVSGKLAQIMINKFNVPSVESEEEVEKVLGKNIEWHGEHPTDKSMPGYGWYSRDIGGKKTPKIMLGRPKNI